jgi:7-cyano-7-deazaguanine synthase
MASGGLDSTTLAYWLVQRNYEVVPIFVDYGQHAASTELGCVTSLLPPEAASRTVTITLEGVVAASASLLVRPPDLWSRHVRDEELILPYRNLMLLSIGAAFASSIGAPELFSAFINSNHAREVDATHAFLEYCEKLFVDYGPVSVRMPFRELSKTEVAKIGLAVGAPIASTFSCQVHPSVHCGACPNCLDRLDALRAVSGH